MSQFSHVFVAFTGYILILFYVKTNFMAIFKRQEERKKQRQKDKETKKQKGREKKDRGSPALTALF